MKHPILIIAFLLLPLLCFSQGITFEQGSWKDALVLAKQTNKPLMLYVYFSEDENSRFVYENVIKGVFSSEPVGDVCKMYFVCYKLDASKKEGLEIAKKYGLTKQSAVLFVNTDGTMLSNLGTMLIGGTNVFMEGAKAVLSDLKDSKPMAAWDAEFPQKKNDQAFLLEYIDKRAKLGLNYNEAFEAYLGLLPANGPMPEQAAKLFHMNSGQIGVTDDAYHYFIKHKKEYSAAIANVYSNPLKEGSILQSMVQHTINEATLSNDEALLNKAIAVFREIPYDYNIKQVEELYMNYYKETKQPDKYLAHARIFVTDNLKKPDSYSESQLSGILNGIAWYIFQNYSDETVLKEALTWSEKTVQLSSIPPYLDTKANILYKLGRKDEAIALQKRAVANLYGSPVNSVYSVTLKKMEAGEKTW